MRAPAYAIPHRIETERLIIRRYVEADAEQLAAVTTRNVEHLRRYMEWIRFEPQSIEQRRAWIAEVNAKADAGEDYTLGMFLRGGDGSEGEFVGGTGFHVRSRPERLAIGYWISSEHEGRGLVTEASAALTVVGLTVTGATVVDISHAPSNERSAAVPARLGFERQDDGGEECFDGGCHEQSVTWFATWDSLQSEPLASTPRPRLLDEAGAVLQWPA
ncbi:GNAT family N-acetyltransferase [Demequina sp. NBRC 110056]|uniref:GNAT family N-acetyltransferase n=1 Tax=Demequina sp. NBRC 110056 TaxID=1570345 RepID=UPI000A0649A9|nr:GNAT family N-acetyltransferase [Demequina sp. NBRC 110056]